MKAIRIHEFGLPEVMKFEEVSDLHPSEGTVLVKIAAAGVNPVEAYIRSGAYARKPVLPYTPGADAAGTVEEVGPGVTSFKAGDRVYTSGSTTGTYAQKAVCEEHHLHLLPDNVDFRQGAALGVPYGTAYRALFQRARAVAGETVLIHGATGGVGIAAVQLSLAAGLTVIATGGSERGRALLAVERVGHVLDHTAPGYLDKIKSITGDRGVDIVLEMLANVNLATDLAVLAKNGRIVVIGSRGNVEINPRDLMARDASILGMTLFNAGAADLQSIHAGIIAGLSNNTLRPVIGKEFPLKDAAAAHSAVMEKGAHGKIILVA
ncbi:MAG TPA: NADPH:quinone reductase [Chitinivibrionales bacterium]|jgi:NADPH2:quinone reductase|nr:NADPH:quinone reductase [Chitinivibrionales bacterium]